jgi:hypothetical protein
MHIVVTVVVVAMRVSMIVVVIMSVAVEEGVVDLLGHDDFLPQMNANERQSKP